MAIVIDAAREDKTESAESMRFMQYHAALAETPIMQKSQNTPTDNTGDAHVPIVTTGSDIS